MIKITFKEIPFIKCFPTIQRTCPNFSNFFIFLILKFFLMKLFNIQLLLQVCLNIMKQPQQNSIHEERFPTVPKERHQGLGDLNMTCKENYLYATECTPWAHSTTQFDPRYSPLLCCKLQHEARYIRECTPRGAFHHLVCSQGSSSRMRQTTSITKSPCKNKHHPPSDESDLDPSP